MSRQYWVAPIGPVTTANAAAYASSAALTDVSPAPQIVLPANLLEVGAEIELNANLMFSTTGTPTLLVGFYYGGVAGAALAASSAITTGSGAASWPVRLNYRGVVKSIGSAGSIVGEGTLHFGTGLTAYSVRPIPETAAARTVTIDTTAAKAITVGAQWGTANASNTLTCYDLSVRLVT